VFPPEASAAYTQMEIAELAGCDRFDVNGWDRTPATLRNGSYELVIVALSTHSAAFRMAGTAFRV